MEWLTCIRTAIDWMEKHLQDDICAEDIAEQTFVSPYFFQKGFSVLMVYGIAEYIRNRRLYQAAMNLLHTDDKVVE